MPEVKILQDEVLVQDKVCKHSIRYASEGERPAARTVYISKEALQETFGTLPEKVHLRLSGTDL